MVFTMLERMAYLLTLDHCAVRCHVRALLARVDSNGLPHRDRAVGVVHLQRVHDKRVAVTASK